MSNVIIYADGGCRGNGKANNVGGYGVVLTQVVGTKTHAKTIKGYDFDTTNNKMELTAAIKALEAIKINKNPIEVYVDSAYVLNGITSWCQGWEARGWRKADKKPVENVELWKQLWALKKSLGFVTFYKCKGHSGDKYNDIADQLANEAMDEATKKLNELN